MTEAEVRTLVTTAAEAAAAQTMRDVFAVLRVDRSDIDSMTAFGDDLRYLRRQRLAAEKISFKAMLGILSAAATGLTAVIWLGLQDVFTR
ncbi:MAG: hypothetical protein ACK4ZU_03915 [Allorhizobium sp.]